MYNDYNVTYETSINEFIIPMLIIAGVLLLLFIIYLIGLAKVFKKANRSGIAAIIPIYNYVVMLEIINRPAWHIILFLVPVLNIIVYCQLLFGIAKSFRKSNAFAILTVLCPLIFIPILGFSDSEYIGINKEAMSGISHASDKPVLKEEDIEATKPQEVKETKPLDISIGGGVYQKEYQESLLEVPEENKKVDMLASFRVQSNEQNIQNVEPEKTGADLLRNVEFIETEDTNKSNFEMSTQVDEPKTITTDEIYNSIPIINQDINTNPVSEPIPSIEDVEPTVDEVIIPSIETNISPVVDINLVNNDTTINQNVNIINDQATNIESTLVNESDNNIVIPDISVDQTINTDGIQNNDLINMDIPSVDLIQPDEVTNISSVVDSLPSNMDDSQYVRCSQCGAVVKKGAPRCFMCGKEI